MSSIANTEPIYNSIGKTYSRNIFRKHLANIDDATWERGRGWALSIAVIMLPQEGQPYFSYICQADDTKCIMKE